MGGQADTCYIITKILLLLIRSIEINSMFKIGEWEDDSTGKKLTQNLFKPENDGNKSKLSNRKQKKYKRLGARAQAPSEKNQKKQVQSKKDKDTSPSKQRNKYKNFKKENETPMPNLDDAKPGMKRKRDQSPEGNSPKKVKIDQSKEVLEKKVKKNRKRKNKSDSQSVDTEAPSSEMSTPMEAADKKKRRRRKKKLVSENTEKVHSTALASTIEEANLMSTPNGQLLKEKSKKKK